MKPAAPLIVLAEKVVSTYVQAFLSLLIVHDTIGADLAQTAAIAAVPTALTAFINALPAVPVGLPFWIDLVLRVVRTYLATFVGLLLAMPVLHLNFTILVATLTSALPAALAVLKGGIAAKVGNTATAALLPAKLDVAV